MLEFKNVSKSFGSIKALEDISIKIHKGEFVFITGSSGAGKTTLLKLILREYLPNKGHIFLDGNDITKLHHKKVPRLRQRIGVVFQDFKVLPERTVYENVAIALAVCGVERSKWNKRVRQVLETVGLRKRRRLFPSQLSGGELQRVSLARALVVNPKIILADEPTGNLDWETADDMMKLLQSINKEGKTVIVATHHKLIVDKIKGRKIKLSKGKLKSDTGKKDEEKKELDEEVENV